MSDGLVRLLTRSCGRDHEGGPRPFCRSEHAVLLIVSGLELIASDKGE
jgi:hypothetical protein